ncbi:MAG: hypothetical protein P4M11_03045 [Candidatus Pacebacteria bacterium]|nr:hypothetical protein [Candidatus Paceibacterota bacterium]
MTKRTVHPIDSIGDLETTFYFNAGALIAIVLFFSITRACRATDGEAEGAEQLLKGQRSVTEHATLGHRFAPDGPPRPALKEEKGKNIFEWIRVLSTIPDQEVIVHCRKDGFLYLLFIKYLYTYFFLLAVGGCGVLLPVFLINSDIDTSLLAAYTIRNILNHKWKLWVVLIFTAIYSLMAFMMLYLFHHRLRSVAATEVQFYLSPFE